jgi:hypothetical protein
MATLTFSAKVSASGRATVVAKSDVIGSMATTSTDASAADTAVGVVVADNAVTIAAIDAAAASIIAITGDTYVAHQFVTGGVTGLTHIQWATQATLLNTAITDYLAGQTATNTAKTASALAKADALAAVSAGPTGGVNITLDLASITTLTQLRAALDVAILEIQGSNLLTP